MKRLVEGLRGQVDRALIFCLCNYSFSAVINPLVAFQAISKLTPVGQGVFYAFSSVIAAQVFFELGFNTCLTQVFSHEAARLSIHSNGCLLGERRNIERVRSSFIHSWRWNGCIALLVLTLINIIGWILFSGRRVGTLEWQGPWVCLCVATALNSLITPFWTFLEGFNQMGWTSSARTCANASRGIGIVIGLHFGLHLYALALGQAANVFVSFAFITTRWHKTFRWLIRPSNKGEIVSWTEEIWPFQSRVAITWVAGYMSTGAIVPIILRLAGPVDAGRFGATSSVVQGLGALSIAWGVLRAPLYGILASNREYQKLFRLWATVGLMSIGTMVLGGIAVSAGIELFSATKFAERMLPAKLVLLMCTGAAFTQAIAAIGLFFRAHKIEKLALSSVVTAVTTIGVSLACISRWGVESVILAQLGCSVAIGLPWAIALFVVFIAKDTGRRNEFRQFWESVRLWHPAH